MTRTNTLKATCTASQIALYRAPATVPFLTQHAQADQRPYIHPLLAPDGCGVLTENTPDHHPWQHGIYVGLNQINGYGFWLEGLGQDTHLDGTFHPAPLEAPIINGPTASWHVHSAWRAPDGNHLLDEKQHWHLQDHDTYLSLDLDWTLSAATDLHFGQYAYGGLFLRMPYRQETGGQALSSTGLSLPQAEGQRARWVAVAMPLKDRSDPAGIAFLDHPDNPEHPVPWRVDGQLGISPSRCIAGSWDLAAKHTSLNRYRILTFCGSINPEFVDTAWNDFSHQNLSK